MSDFQKTNSQSEVVIIKRMEFSTSNGDIQHDKLTILIEKELRKRKNMKLSHIQNLDWGRNRNRLNGFILVFEERDETLASIKQELAEIKDRLYSL
jgi:hypothetical protein